MNAKDLTKEIEKLKRDDVRVSCHTVWNTEQIKEVIESYDSHNELIKMEITHGFEPGKKSFQLIVWYYPINL